MTVTSEEELEKLKAIGRIVAAVRDAMAKAARPGMTTAELDAIGKRMLDDAGALSAPETTYQFPGATCISVNEEIAHGIPGERVLAEGDLVNVDVSAEKDGFFSDTGASFFLGAVDKRIERLCRDGRRALFAGIGEVRADAPLGRIGAAVGAFARKNRYTLVKNLASHGIGRGLHEEPGEIPTWPDRSERRSITEGLVFTVEPFLSLGAEWAVDGEGPWTLYSDTGAPTVQYEHTLVATRRGAVILTLP
jgi:methionyl aminopeptidase